MRATLLSVLLALSAVSLGAAAQPVASNKCPRVREHRGRGQSFVEKGLTMKTLDELLAKIKVNEKTGCWEWQGTCGTGGYGQVNVVSKKTGHYTTTKAHRFSWELHFGPFPKSLCVCHKCDNPPCVNPYHLFLGTPKENTADLIRKGRRQDQLGESNPFSVLNEELVREIRRLYENGLCGQRELSRRYGVSRGTIQAVVHRITWRHVA